MLIVLYTIAPTCMVRGLISCKCPGPPKSVGGPEPMEASCTLTSLLLQHVRALFRFLSCRICSQFLFLLKTSEVVLQKVFPVLGDISRERYWIWWLTEIHSHSLISLTLLTPCGIPNNLNQELNHLHIHTSHDSIHAQTHVLA